jgi:hypothetical protein
MKATLDIPDMLYRQVKAKSALEGHPIRLVAIDLFSAWVNAKPKEATRQEEVASRKPDALPSWFGVARLYASKVKRHDMETVRESIAQGRGGL